MDFNKQQRLAIDTRGGQVKNILVSAGAGSGKTAVLAERVVSLICNTENDINIDNLLIMTFTNAAAAEMRERIASELKKRRSRLADNPMADPRELVNVSNQLSLLNKASISTIESYCGLVARRYFYKVGIDPSFRIAGGDDCRELAGIARKVMDELFEERLEAGDKDFLLLTEYFCATGYDTQPLRDILEEISMALGSMPFPQKWLDEALSLYLPSSEKRYALLKRYIKYMCDMGLGIIDRELKAIAQVKEKYSDDKDICACAKLLENEKVFLTIAELIREMASETDYEKIRALLQRSLPALSRKRAPKEIAYLFDRMRDNRTSFKVKIWDKLREGFCLEKAEFDAVTDMYYKITKTLFSLWREFDTLFGQKKTELAIASFSDVNHYCIRILYNEDGSLTPEALKLREEYAEVIVDEYQDTNSLQECVLMALTKEKDNLFMVGDIKQSIYKFRNACPENFAAKYNSYSRETASEGDICIPLNLNYRSRKSVLDVVNFLFYQLMRRDFGGIEYDKAAALEAGFNYPKAPSGLNISAGNEMVLCVKQNEAVDEDIAEMESDEAQAHIIAQKITSLIDEKNPVYVYDKSLEDYRPCNLGDIAVIMRSPNKVGYIYAGILNRYGIPTVSPGKYSLFNQLEVKTVMALLKVLDNPYMDKELITVLHSPIFNVSCKELAMIRLVNKKAFMYDNVREYIKKAEGDDPVSEKLKGFNALWDKVHSLTETSSFPQVLNAVYRLTDYMNYAGLIQNGKIRVKNLKLLSKLAEEIIASGVTDFGGIVKGLAEMEKDDMIVESKAAIERGSAVLITSIHKSKGLEFPIVIMAQTSLSLKKTPSDFIISHDMGLSFGLFDTKTRVKSPFLYRSIISALSSAEDLTEELRLLYVALTRAREKFILVGTVNDLEKSREYWQSFSDYSDEGLCLPYSACVLSNSYLDWIMIALNRRDTLNAELEKRGMETIDIDNLLHIDLKTLEEIKEDEIGTEHIRAAYEAIDPKNAPQKELDKLREKMLMEYLDKAAIALPSKISVSEIKRQYQAEEYKQLEYDLTLLDAPASPRILNELSGNKERDTSVQFDAPQFLSQGEAKLKLSAAQRGTAYHIVLEHLSYGPHTDLEDIKAQLEAFKEKGILSQSEYEAINPRKIYKFAVSPLAKRVCASPKVYREAPFVMQLDPKEVYKTGEYGKTKAKILVHGIIDLYFEEAGDIILADYKTDRVDEENTSSVICERYRVQLNLYKRAIEQGSGKKVKEMYLYLISSDEAVRLEE